MTLVQGSLLGTLPPKRVFGLALVVAGVLVPAAGVAWATVRLSFVGELSIGHQKLDPRWAWPLIGLQGLLVVGVLGLVALLLFRRATWRTQNITTLSVLAVHLALIGLFLAHA